MNSYFCNTDNFLGNGSKRFHFTIEPKTFFSIPGLRFRVIFFGSTVKNWNCDNSTPKQLKYEVIKDA